MRRPCPASGLSALVVVISGCIAAFFIAAAVYAVAVMLPRWTPSYANAEKLMERGKFSDALKIASRLPRGDGNGADVDVLTGRILLGLAYEREAREKWRRYGLDESDWFTPPEAAQAVEVLRRAVKKNPDDRDAHYYLALVCMEKGWFSESETELLEVLRIQPRDVNGRITLGVLYSRMGRYRDAENELLEAGRIDPQDTGVMRNLAFLYRYYLDDPHNAMIWSNRYLNAAAEKDPVKVMVHHDFEELSRRYPEYIPEEKQVWKTRREKNRFGAGRGRQWRGDTTSRPDMPGR